MRDVFKADKMHGELHCPANNRRSNLRTSWVACISASPLPAWKPWSRWGWFWRLCKAASVGGELRHATKPNPPHVKFPPDYVTTYYRDAAEAIARFLAGGTVDFGIPDNFISVLSQKVAGNVYETRRIAGNIDAIETFNGLLDDPGSRNSQSGLIRI